MSHSQEIKSTLLGGVLTVIYNFDMLFVGDVLKALFLGAVGALGSFLMNQALKRLKKWL